MEQVIVKEFEEILKLNEHIARVIGLISGNPELKDGADRLRKLLRQSTPSIIKTEEHPEIIIKTIEAEAEILEQNARNLGELAKKENTLLKDLQSISAELKSFPAELTESKINELKNLSGAILRYDIAPLEWPKSILRDAIRIVSNHSQKLIALLTAYNLSKEPKLVKIFNSIKEDYEKMVSKLGDIERIEFSAKTNELKNYITRLIDVASYKDVDEVKKQRALILTVLDDVMKEKNNEINEIKEATKIYKNLNKNIQKFMKELKKFMAG